VDISDVWITLLALQNVMISQLMFDIGAQHSEVYKNILSLI